MPEIKEKINMDLPSKTERTWAMLCHISIFSGTIIPFGNLLVPLVILRLNQEGKQYIYRKI